MTTFRIPARRRSPALLRRLMRGVASGRGAVGAVGVAGVAGGAGAQGATRSPQDPGSFAHAVPWVLRRPSAGVVEVEHCGSGALHSVRFSLAGGGALGLTLPRTMLPGERLRACLRGPEAEGSVTAPDAMLVLRWFQPDGEELLWPVAL